MVGTLIDAKLGEKYREWAAKLRGNPSAGDILVKATSTYLGDGGIVSRAKTAELPLALEGKEAEHLHALLRRGPSHQRRPAHLALDEARLKLRGSVDLNGYYETALAPVGFHHIEMRLTLRSGEPEERLRRLVDEAERRCPFSGRWPTHQITQSIEIDKGAETMRAES